MNTQSITSYVEMCGLRIATTNFGIDAKHPMGKYYKYDDAQKVCPIGWRPMTHEEYIALCEHTWKRVETRDGIKGLSLRDDNSVEIFLPLAGYMELNGDVREVGIEGNYWSSSPHPSYDNQSYHLEFDYIGAVYPSNGAYLSNGLSLRCVQEIASNK